MSAKPIQLARSVRLWPGDKSESRRASWLELFFDLIGFLPRGETLFSHPGALAQFDFLQRVERVE